MQLRILKPSVTTWSSYIFNFLLFLLWHNHWENQRRRQLHLFGYLQAKTQALLEQEILDFQVDILRQFLVLLPVLDNLLVILSCIEHFARQLDGANAWIVCRGKVKLDN